MRSNSIPDRTLAALIKSLRKPTESIWQCSAHNDRHFSVSLIESSKIEQAQNMMAIGLARGEGRSLDFTKINGVWMQLGEGYWIG